MIYKIIYILFTIASLIGIFSFLKYRKKKQFQEHLKLFSFVFIMPIFDVFSTFLFVRKWGIESESNPIGRWLMYNLGNFAYPVMYILTIPALFLIFCFCYFSFDKGYFLDKKIYIFLGKKPISRKKHSSLSIKSLTITFIVFYIFVVIWNII